MKRLQPLMRKLNKENIDSVKRIMDTKSHLAHDQHLLPNDIFNHDYIQEVKY